MRALLLDTLILAAFVAIVIALLIYFPIAVVLAVWAPFAAGIALRRGRKQVR